MDNFKCIPKIVFEGLDCSYKETNSKKLKEYLESKGYNIIYTSFPRYNKESSKDVRAYLNGSYNKILNLPISLEDKLKEVVGLYMKDMKAWKEEIDESKELFKDNTIIILDRFYLSNLYYLIPDLVLLKKDNKTSIYQFQHMIAKYALKEFKLFKPNIVFKMISDPNLIQKKAIERGGLDAYESNKPFMDEVYKIYKKLNFNEYIETNDEMYNGVIEINTINKNEEEVFKQIKNCNEVKYFVQR